MRIGHGIFNVIGLLMLLLMVPTFMNYQAISDRDFDALRLNLAVEYATEAMFSTTLKTNDIGTDYVDLEQITIDTTLATETFDAMMCLNYDLSLSKRNYAHIESFIAAAVITSDDGYYILESVIDETTDEIGLDRTVEYTNRWSPKIPYTTKDIYGNTYSYSVAGRAYTEVGADGRVVTRIAVGYPGGTSGIDTKQDAIAYANKQLTNAMLDEIDAKNGSGEFLYRFKLPSETTMTGVNPISGASALVLMQGLDFASTEKLDAISVSGFKAVAKRRIVAFYDIANPDRLYYCLDGQIGEDEINTKYIIVDYFGSMIDAAKAGYEPNVHLMSR